MVAAHLSGIDGRGIEIEIFLNRLAENLAFHDGFHVLLGFLLFLLHFLQLLFCKLDVVLRLFRQGKGRKTGQQAQRQEKA